MSHAYIAQAADHQQLEWTAGTGVSILLDGAVTGGQVTVVRSRLREGSASPLHVHRHEDEMFVILRGHGLFWVGEDCHEVGEGGAVFLPRNVPHAFRFTSPEVDLLTIGTPSGLEAYFRSAGRDVRDPRPEGWEITPEDLVEAGRVADVEVLGPPR